MSREHGNNGDGDGDGEPRNMRSTSPPPPPWLRMLPGRRSTGGAVEIQNDDQVEVECDLVSASMIEARPVASLVQFTCQECLHRIGPVDFAALMYIAPKKCEGCGHSALFNYQCRTGAPAYIKMRVRNCEPLSAFMCQEVFLIDEAIPQWKTALRIWKRDNASPSPVVLPSITPSTILAAPRPLRSVVTSDERQSLILSTAEDAAVNIVKRPMRLFLRGGLILPKIVTATPETENQDNPSIRDRKDSAVVYKLSPKRRVRRNDVVVWQNFYPVEKPTLIVTRLDPHAIVYTPSIVTPTPSSVCDLSHSRKTSAVGGTEDVLAEGVATVIALAEAEAETQEQDEAESPLSPEIAGTPFFRGSDILRAREDDADLEKKEISDTNGGDKNAYENGVVEETKEVTAGEPFSKLRAALTMSSSPRLDLRHGSAFQSRFAGMTSTPKPCAASLDKWRNRPFLPQQQTVTSKSNHGETKRKDMQDNVIKSSGNAQPLPPDEKFDTLWEMEEESEKRQRWAEEAASHKYDLLCARAGRKRRGASRATSTVGGKMDGDELVPRKNLRRTLENAQRLMERAKMRDRAKATAFLASSIVVCNEDEKGTDGALTSERQALKYARAGIGITASLPLVEILHDVNDDTENPIDGVMKAARSNPGKDTEIEIEEEVVLERASVLRLLTSHSSLR